jgi:hypothetical protein
MSGKRQTLWNAVKGRMALINGTGGYQTSVGSDIREWQLTPLERTDIDCLLISDPREVPGEDQNKNSGGFNRYLEFELKAFLAESTASPEKARKVEEDLIKAIGVDERWGGLARRTHMGISEIAVDEKGARIGGLDFTIRIEFSRARWEA